ncbi:hypothetical protein JQS43_04510 [Natronosporangium hydrolyticum]|uniref:DUF4190 domain-containing protein n=1 Tax=Natronosporangium hydrolyticum TaxID=2811111 RepID=A0A895YLQ8_9ACTN|nr:hypothetical protein [Natronosporangium hydrolyticum]QSB15616.1 hypothetical protein JQS43_04510 [Natronosporangium hydrolyticum]
MTAPGAPGAPATGGSNKATLFGILGIVLSFVCCGIVGVVFGVLSMNQAKKFGTSTTLGIVTIVIGSILTVLQLIGGLTAL